MTDSTIDQSICKMYEALSKAQGEFPAIPKDREVKVYSKPPDKYLLYTYKYADLTTIIDCTRKALSANGLSFNQDYDETRGGFFTRLQHKEGGCIVTGFVKCKIESLDMKTIAGLYTYAKRISLTAALGVSADEDVDAAHDEAKSGNSTTKEDLKPQSQKQDPRLDPRHMQSGTTQSTVRDPLPNRAPQTKAQAQTTGNNNVTDWTKQYENRGPQK